MRRLGSRPWDDAGARPDASSDRKRSRSPSRNPSSTRTRSGRSSSEGMGLVESTAAYLDGPGRDESGRCRAWCAVLRQREHAPHHAADAARLLAAAAARRGRGRADRRGQAQKEKMRLSSQAPAERARTRSSRAAQGLITSRCACRAHHAPRPARWTAAERPHADNPVGAAPHAAEGVQPGGSAALQTATALHQFAALAGTRGQGCSTQRARQRKSPARGAFSPFRVRTDAVRTDLLLAPRPKLLELDC